MKSKKAVQHVYLVGAKSMGAYGGYETFVYKLTEYHQNKDNIKYHVACKANGDGCMLLDFSKNEYPILIDQPEDDLDNRAIFEELVKYLRAKKLNRQIILVTHNPNVVVGADAEEIIVANQEGIGNSNPENIKFAYKCGALENSFKTGNSEILLSCGIREHVCELLEGGNKAFRLREKKYQLI